MSKVKIICDFREQRTSIIKRLYEMGILIETEALPVGDFILSNRVCVERKTIKDLLQSIIDKRLFKQVKELNSNFDNPIIIVEGIENIYEERMIHPNAIRGALASLAIDYRIPILQTTCENETAHFLKSIARREQIDKKTSISLRGEKKPIESKFLQEYIIGGFPGIGRETAKNLLTYFKTIKKIVNADTKDLKKVKNVGEKTAKNLKEINEKRYE